jgi:rubrerythrin
MSQWNSASEILDFAIQNEEQAAKFYTDLAGKMESASMRQVFEDFAREEQGHKAKLLGVQQSGKLEPASRQVVDLKIGDYLVDAEPGPEMDYQQALILAMKQEKAAFKLYTDLAAATADADLRSLLLALAQEEAKHKLRFEVEYDEHILTEN